MNTNRSYESEKLKPQLLYAIPKNLEIKEEIINRHFIFAFPNGFEMSDYEEQPKIYSIVLTDEKGERSYLYILIFYDKICDFEFRRVSRYSNNLNSNEIMYCPASIIITSYYSNIEFFRGILTECYKIIKFDTSNIINIINESKEEKGNKIDISKIKSYQKLELFNYLNFFYEILRPPNKSIFTLNLKFSSLRYTFLSKEEIPTNDYCMKVLFDSLEISVILKLFVGLLFEKHILIIANQHTSLFCICEALQFLIFPFKWLHTYIPNLPYDQMDYLESPTPFLMGMNNPQINSKELIETYPYLIVCDVTTSTICGNTDYLKLPLNEEKKIKKKLLLLLNKHKNCYDDIYYYENRKSNISNSNSKVKVSEDNNNKINDVIDENEDVDFKMSFAQNIQNIFFRIFKNNFKNLKKDYITNDVFNSKQFLNSFEEDDYKLFFEKIINTLAFDYFVSSMQYLDDSLSRQFNLICNTAHLKKNKYNINDSNYYEYKFTYPSTLPDNILNIDKKDIENYNEVSKAIISLKNESDFNKELRDSGNFSSVYSLKNNEDININKFSYLSFYEKSQGFLSFIINNKIDFSFHSSIINEVLKIYRNYMKDEQFIIQEDINENISETKEDKIMDVTIDKTAQFYFIIALYLYSEIFKTKNVNLQLTRSKSKSSKCVLESGLKKYQKEIKKGVTKTNINNILNESKNDFPNNITILKLFIQIFRKNVYEFPRNLFINLLSNFTKEELKSLEVTNIKYIDKTLIFQIKKIEKVAFKTMVIINDGTDNEDDLYDLDDNYLFPNKSIQNDTFDSGFRKGVRKNTIDYRQITDEGKNFQKTKLNVIDITQIDNALHNNLQQKANINSSLNYTTLKANYKQKKAKHFLNSSSSMSFNNINDIIINNKNLQADPLSLSEHICVKLYSVLSCEKIENYSEKNCDVNFLKDLAHGEEFEDIKNLILGLKNINLIELSQRPKNYYCFWLNMFNFLTIFSIIYKCEVITNYYEWHRFLKNSYFTIGGVEISLFEIEFFILRGETITKRIYNNIIINSNYSKPDLPKIEPFNDFLINYGISLPTFSSPSIRIYFPFNLNNSLTLNAIEFFQRTINIDFEEQNIEIPEYILWIDPSFYNNLDNYKNLLPQEFVTFTEQNKQFAKIMIKFDWKLNYINFKNLESFH